MTDTIEAQAATDVREVRQNADEVIHRSTGAGRYDIRTVCGQQLTRTVRDARHWQGSAPPVLAECAECFAPEAVDDMIQQGDLVTLLRHTGGGPSHPRGWTPSQVYVYVGPSPVASDRSTVLVEDGWYVNEEPSRMPPVSIPADLATPRQQAWTVRTDLMQHAPAGTDPDEVLVPRIRRARNRLIALRPDPETREPQPVPEVAHPVQHCEHTAHPEEDHTHTPGMNPLWGNPGTGSGGTNRMIHPDDGSYVLFNRNAAPTEREATPVPESTCRFSVGENLHPLSFEKLRDLPRNSVLTITSRPRGTLNSPYIQFGCQSWTLTTLQANSGTISFSPEGTSVTVDYTHDGRNNEEVTILGNRINLGEFNNYAATVIVKEIGVVTPDNALVMEHGFYGCATHDACVIFVGNGHPNGSREPLPVVGRMHPTGGGGNTPNRLTGTVGTSEGLRNVNLRDCTPIASPTTAVTMNVVAERRWSLVPCTPEQVERNAALPRFRLTGAAMEAARVGLCTSEGVPVTADPSPF